MPERNEEKILERKIKYWKNKLIDVSRRNRLLNFRPHKRATLKIVDELPSEVFKSLVYENSSFQFLPKIDEELSDHNRDEYETDIDNHFHSYD